jgi:hypothetical protein
LLHRSIDYFTFRGECTQDLRLKRGYI